MAATYSHRFERFTLSQASGSAGGHDWCVQYKLHGRNINEAVGWWNDGASQSQCESLLSELRINQKNGLGPQTLKDMRSANKERREAEAVAKEVAAQKNRTLAGFMELEYLPRAELSQARRTIEAKKGLMRNFLTPLADRKLAEIATADLENEVLRPMLQAGKGASYIGGGQFQYPPGQCVFIRSFQWPSPLGRPRLAYHPAGTALRHLLKH